MSRWTSKIVAKGVKNLGTQCSQCIAKSFCTDQKDEDGNCCFGTFEEKFCDERDEVCQLCVKVSGAGSAVALVEEA